MVLRIGFRERAGNELREHLPLDRLDLASLRHVIDPETQDKWPSALDLGIKIARSIKAMNLGNLDRRQDDARQKLVDAQWMVDADDLPTQSKMEEYFHIFDDLFFSGLLKDFVSLKLESEELWDEAQFYVQGQTESPTENQMCEIHMWQSRRRVQQSTFLTVLLHEMVHAVLNLYSCHCDDCLPSLGHGGAWEMIAYALERQIQFGQLPFDDSGHYKFDVRKYM